MTISYPVSMPTNVSQASISISQMNNVGQSESPYTYESQVQAYDGERWIAEINLPAMAREEAAPWIAFLASIRGKYGSFLLGDVKATDPLGAATGTPRVNGGSQTGRVLITDGWTNSTNNILKAGDFISIGQKLYMNLTDVNSDGSGNATLDIWPALRESPSDNQSITTQNCKGVFKLTDTTTQLYTIDSRGAYLVSFSAVESL
jgi:hypothetical protein